MKNIRETKWARRVEHVLYYVFLIGTVGMALLFIPLHSRLKESKEVTQRQTNATGERAYVEVQELNGFVVWAKELDARAQGEIE